MSGLRNFTLTVSRVNGAGNYDANGRWIESAKSTFNIKASVQPLTPREMEMLPEARREKEAFRIYSDTKLNPASDKDGKNADIVAINGKNFEVLSCGSWQNNIISHYKTIAVLI